MTERNTRRGAIVKIVLIMLIFALTLGTLLGLSSQRLGISQPVRVGIITAGVSLAGAFLRHRYRDALSAK
jgi:hypothetical protein